MIADEWRRGRSISPHNKRWLKLPPRVKRWIEDKLNTNNKESINVTERHYIGYTTPHTSE